MTEFREGLKLLEKGPGFGQVTVLVGPDGGGKSFLANQLIQSHPEAVLIKGSQPQSWPIPEKDKLRLVNLKKRYKDDNFRYYGLHSLALHKIVRELAKQGTDVIVDSEPTFKWLMWQELRGNLDKAVAALTAHEIKAVLPDSIRYIVPFAENFDQQAELILQRQNSKADSEKSSVDPKNLEEVKARLKASENVILAMEKLGVSIEGKPAWLV